MGFGEGGGNFLEKVSPSFPISFLLGFLNPLLQRGFHLFADGGEGLGAVRFEAGDEDGLGVGRADKPPAVGEIHARAVPLDGVVEGAEMGFHLSTTANLALSGQGMLISRVAKDAGQPGSSVMGLSCAEKRATNRAEP